MDSTDRWGVQEIVKNGIRCNNANILIILHASTICLYDAPKNPESVERPTHLPLTLSAALQPNLLQSKDAANDWFNVPVARIDAYIKELKGSIGLCNNLLGLRELKEEIPSAIASLKRSRSEAERTIKDPTKITSETHDATWQSIFVRHWQAIDDLIFQLEKLMHEVEARISRIEL